MFNGNGQLLFDPVEVKKNKCALWRLYYSKITWAFTVCRYDVISIIKKIPSFEIIRSAILKTLFETRIAAIKKKRFLYPQIRPLNPILFGSS
jgi:hypothetical protein